MTKMSPFFNNFPARAVIAATAAGFITACSHPLLNSNKDVEVMPFNSQEITTQDLPADTDQQTDQQNALEPESQHAKKREPHVAKHKASKRISRSSAIVSHTKAKPKAKPKEETTEVVAQVEEISTPTPPAPMDMLKAHEDAASKMPPIPIEESGSSNWIMWVVGALVLVVMYTMVNRTLRARRERQHTFSMTN